MPDGGSTPIKVRPFKGKKNASAEAYLRCFELITQDNGWCETERVMQLADVLDNLKAGFTYEEVKLALLACSEPAGHEL